MINLHKIDIFATDDSFHPLQFFIIIQIGHAFEDKKSVVIFYLRKSWFFYILLNVVPIDNFKGNLNKRISFLVFNWIILTYWHARNNVCCNFYSVLNISSIDFVKNTPNFYLYLCKNRWKLMKNSKLTRWFKDVYFDPDPHFSALHLSFLRLFGCTKYPSDRLITVSYTQSSRIKDFELIYNSKDYSTRTKNDFSPKILVHSTQKQTQESTRKRIEASFFKKITSRRQTFSLSSSYYSGP